MGLTILQWNARSLVSKWTEFTILASQFDIICINETFLKNKHIFGNFLKGYYCIREDKPSQIIGGGVAIYIRDYLEFKRINNIMMPIDIEWIGIEVNWNNQKLNIINILLLW